MLRSRIFALAALAPAFAAGLFVASGGENDVIIAPCDSPLYCLGPLLHQIQMARPFGDSKVFVDMPPTRTLAEILSGFDALPKPIANDSALHAFLADHFAPPGSELRTVSHREMMTNPTFLPAVADDVLREFVGKVIDIWPDMVRVYDPHSVCRAAAPSADRAGSSRCPVGSFLPINGSRQFVVAGGLGARFREPYYWDSYWTLLGLLRTGGTYITIARNQIENFLDFIEEYGFVPNGARAYYLNRSQPPVLALMVREYIACTNDTSILDRALPLLMQEHEFFAENRSVEIRTAAGATYVLNRYAVLNNQPRPESYPEDYETATNTSLSDEARARLYADLSTGAETGWDFSSRWLARPQEAMGQRTVPSLLSINTRAVVSVDLNAILYGVEVAIADFHRVLGRPEAEAAAWAGLAANRSEAMFALMWNETLGRYYDYNLTAGGQNFAAGVIDHGDDDAETAMFGTGDKANRQTILFEPDAQIKAYFNLAQYFPFWTGAVPAHIRTDPAAIRNAFEPIAAHLARHPGGVPATSLATTQQWDSPNVWAPLMHVLIDSLLAVAPPAEDSDEDYVWTQSLALELAQRWVDSTFCTWYATGGSTSHTPALPGFEDRHGQGIMFEKYVDWSLAAAGRGAEYSTDEGFGWTNGVLIWVAATFGPRLHRPECGKMSPIRAR